MATASPAYQQKLQEAQVAYNEMAEQYKRTQAVEKQMKDLENYLAQLKRVNSSSSSSSSQAPTSLSDLQRQLIESKNKIHNLIPPDSKPPAVFAKVNEVKQVERMVHGIRQILSRKQAILNSIEFLNKEEQSLISENGDLQNQLSSCRIWLNDKEEELINENQQFRNEFLALENAIKDDQKQYKAEIERIVEKNNQLQVRSYEFEFLTSQAQKQIDDLQEEISKNISSLSPDNQKLVQDMLASIQSLKERSKQYNEIISSTKFLNVINNGTKILTDEANKMVKDFNAKKANIKVLQEKLQSAIKDHNETREYLEDQKNIFNELNNQRLAKEKKKQELDNKIKKLEDDRMELLVKQEKADSSSRFGKPFREATNKIKAEEEAIEAQKKDLEFYKKLSESLAKDAEQLKDLASKNPSDAYQSLKPILDQEEKTNSELQTKLNEKYNQLSVDTKQKRNEVDKLISKIMQRTQQEGAQSNSVASSGSSFCHGYTLLPQFEASHATYDIDAEKNEASVNLATKDVLLDLIFFKDINQTNTGFLPQLILIWHQNRFPMHEFADLITQRLKNQSSGKPIIPDLTDQEAFDCCDKLFTQWNLYFKHDFYDPDTQKSAIAMLEQMKQLTEDDDNKESIDNRIDELSTKFNTKSDSKDLPYDESDEKPKDPKKFTPLSLKPKSMAEHFMYIDLNNFQKIESYEYVKGAWGKPGKETNAPHINNLTVRFNLTAKMVLNTILSAAEIKKDTKDEILKAAEKRAKVIEGWIKIMEAAKQIHDYNLIFEIDAAFTNPAISKKKLPYTYEKVNPDLLKKREELSSLTAPNQKFKAYKADLEKSPVGETLLYMGPWQTEMTFIDDGNKSSIPLPSGEDALNCKKQQAYFIQLAFLKKGWGEKYKKDKFKLNPIVLKQIQEYELLFKDDASLRKASADTHEFDQWNKEHPK